MGSDTEIEIGSFVVGIAERCGGHDEWLGLVRFGLKWLLEHQDVLMYLITTEAARQSKIEQEPEAVCASTIFKELGLRFYVPAASEVKK